MSSVPSALELHQLRAEAARLKRLRELRESYGLNFYRPHWKQHLFHICQAVGRYGRTGNRFGKSEMGIAEDISWCMGGRPWYRETFDILDGEGNVREHHVGRRDHPFITCGIPQRPVKGLLIVVDWDMAKRIFTNREGSYEVFGKLWRLLPTEAIGKVTNGGRGDRIEKVEIKRPREFGGGSSTLSIDTIESYKHNKLGAESADWDFIHVDEPVPEGLYTAHARGLMDRNGSFWFTCTPLDQMWINDMFTPPNRRSLDDQPDGLTFVPESESGKAGELYVITGSIYDNPHRSESGVANFESKLTREERECRLYGRPLAMAGMVYKEFIYDLHVLPGPNPPIGWSDFHLPPADYTIRVAWDVHGVRVGQMVLFAATAPDGTVFIYDEIAGEPGIQATAKRVKEKTAGRNVAAWIIDPRALIVNPVTETADVIDAIMEEELYFEPGSKDLTVGISAVKDKLLERNIVNRGFPTIYFSPRLKETLYEFTHYIYDLEKNKPKDEHDHMMENLYRLVLNGLDYIAPPTESDYAFRRSTVIRDHEASRGLTLPRSYS